MYHGGGSLRLLCNNHPEGCSIMAILPLLLLSSFLSSTIFQRRYLIEYTCLEIGYSSTCRLPYHGVKDGEEIIPIMFINITDRARNAEARYRDVPMSTTGIITLHMVFSKTLHNFMMRCTRRSEESGFIMSPGPDYPPREEIGKG